MGQKLRNKKLDEKKTYLLDRDIKTSQIKNQTFHSKKEHNRPRSNGNSLTPDRMNNIQIHSIKESNHAPDTLLVSCGKTQKTFIWRLNN